MNLDDIKQESEMRLKSMKAGDGKTSYANNSGLQKNVILKTWPMLDETFKHMFTAENGFPKRIRIADLGCASGPNAVLVASHIMDTIQDLCKNDDNDSNNSVNRLPEVEVFLNDLPDNDFNNLFKLFPTKSKCFIYGAPGSFYGRLFPSKTLHFVYSSYSLHWLSQIPEGVGKNNKENIFISMKSPAQVVEAYAKQFQRDFSTFLSLRSQELTTGGCIVSALLARESEHFSSSDDAIQCFTPLAEILLHMVAQGIVKENDLYSFNLPLYTPCLKEIETIITDEGSFNREKMEVVWVPWEANEEYDGTVFDKYRSGKLVADGIRALMEPLLVSHFGTSLDLDHVFDIYADKMADCLSNVRPLIFSLVISLTSK